MGKHFLSVLGTSLYEPVIYEDGEFKSSEQVFIQLALVERFYKDLLEPDSKISLFLTDGAKERNYENRVYSEKEEGFAQKWVSNKKKDVKANTSKQGLKEQFLTRFPELEPKLEVVSIEDAQTEEQIWNVFSSIYDSLREGDEIIFDITHSFRSIPMLAMTVINYAKILKNCSLTGIYYGAYEAAVVSGEAKVAPINNLTIYNEILEWTNAANTFMRYGNASMIKEVFDQKYNSLPKEEKPEWSSLKKMVNKVENLSDTIQTCRGADGTELEMKARKKNKCSVKSAYALFREELSQKEEREQTSMKPLVPLFEKVKEKFSVFEKENNYEVGMAVTAWSIENGMIQQGYTSLEETIKTWICHNYGLNEVDERNREGIVGFIINEMKQQEIQNPKKDWQNPDIRWEAVCPIVEKKLQGNNNQDDSELLKKMERMVKELDFDLVILAREIKNKRNDINHFGMRKNPMEASGLKSELEKYFTQFQEIVERKEAAGDDGTMERSF